MGEMMRLALVPALIVALCGCDQAKIYPLAPDAIAATLTGSQIPAIAFGMRAHCAPGEAMAQGVQWRVIPGPDEPYDEPAPGAAAMLLTARIVPVSGGTRVDVDIAPADPANAQAFAGGMAARPAVAAMFRTIAREQVDARLDHRAFNLAHVRASMAAAALSMLPEIRQSMDRDAAAIQQRGQTNIDDAYKAASHDGPAPQQDGVQDAVSNP